MASLSIGCQHSYITALFHKGHRSCFQMAPNSEFDNSYFTWLLRTIGNLTCYKIQSLPCLLGKHVWLTIVSYVSYFMLLWTNYYSKLTHNINVLRVSYYLPNIHIVLLSSYKPFERGGEVGNPLVSFYWQLCLLTMLDDVIKKETFCALLAHCAMNPPATGRFLSQKSVTRSFGVLFDLRLNNWLSKQSTRR